MSYVGAPAGSTYTPPTPPVEPPPPPPPPDDVGITQAYYVKSDGSDGDDGTELNPFATIEHVLGLAPPPGTGIILKGGSPLSGAGNRGISIVSGLSGAGGAPITVLGAPGEGAQVDCDGNGFFISSVLPASHWRFANFELLNATQSGNGVITWSATSGLADDVVVQGLTIHKVLPGGNDTPVVYFGSRTGDKTVEWCRCFGPGYAGDLNDDGPFVQTDHAAVGGGVLTVRYNLVVDMVKGVQIYGDDGDARVVIDWNSFKDCGANIEVVHYATAQVRNNFGTTALAGSAENVYDSGEGVLTQDHNVWGGTFDVDYTIATPSSALTASSLGGPVGAIDNA